MNLHVSMDSYELFSSVLLPPGFVQAPLGRGWDLVAVFDRGEYIVMLWRRSLIQSRLEEDLCTTESPTPALAPLDPTQKGTAAAPFVPPKSQRERLKVPRGVFED